VRGERETETERESHTGLNLLAWEARMRTVFVQRTYCKDDRRHFDLRFLTLSYSSSCQGVRGGVRKKEARARTGSG
jgi:hypothetical protein